jgi:hypothetical protein
MEYSWSIFLDHTAVLLCFLLIHCFLGQLHGVEMRTSCLHLIKLIIELPEWSRTYCWISCICFRSSSCKLKLLAHCLNADFCLLCARNPIRHMGAYAPATPKNILKCQKNSNKIFLAYVATFYVRTSSFAKIRYFLWLMWKRQTKRLVHNHFL